MIGQTRGRAMLASLHGYWEQAEDYQRFLYCVGAGQGAECYEDFRTREQGLFSLS